MKKRALAATLLFIAAATTARAADDVVAEADKIVKAANWEAMETVTVVLKEHEYTPGDLRFKAGTAYKLSLRNQGEKSHYFTAPEFYKAIATRKAEVEGKAEIKAPYFKALEVTAPGGEIDLYFVPVRKGSYDVYCTIDDHREKGMEGRIVIE